MTTLARILITLYTGAAACLAAITLYSYCLVPLWASIANTAATVALLCAASHTYDDACEIRDMHARLDATARPATDYQPAYGLSEAEQQAFEEIADHWKDAA